MRVIFRPALLLAALYLVFTASVRADDSQFRIELWKLTNQFRVANGRPPLFLSDALSKSAQNYAEMMARQRFFGHDAPNGSTMTSRIEAGGYSSWTSIGENLGAGYKSPREVFDGWLASPSHRENILNPNFREIGIGYSTIPDSPYIDYWVENFGTRPGTVAAQSASKPGFLLGFESFYRAAPAIIGEPLEEVWHLGQSSTSSLAIQRTTKGILLWLKPVNQMIFVGDTEAFTYRDGAIEPLSESERQAIGTIAGRPPPLNSATSSDEPNQAGN